MEFTYPWLPPKCGHLKEVCLLNIGGNDRDLDTQEEDHQTETTSASAMFQVDASPLISKMKVPTTKVVTKECILAEKSETRPKSADEETEMNQDKSEVVESKNQENNNAADEEWHSVSPTKVSRYFEQPRKDNLSIEVSPSRLSALV